MEDSAKYGGNLGYFNDHGLVQRFKKDGWTSEQIAEGYRGIYDSPNTVVIPNVLGKNPVAQEALWNPVGSHDRSWYMPILPYKRGFQTVTMYDPKTSKVEHLLKERGYWEGGPNSSIFPPSPGKMPAEQVGSGPISAVSTPFESTLQEQLKKLKLKAPAVAGAGTGAGLASWPADAPGCVNREPGLETSFFDPVDMLTAGIGVSGMRKALSMVMEPAVAYGMEKTGNWVGNRVKGLLEYFMGMMNDARGEVEREVQEKAEKKACAP
ncbi:hypothetical protein [Mailhella massiliensis]|uniref:hypothetical protein n=1 Tax=Mailhella massiliensis TaxID=1903261 RepID=UPI001184F208|nr:hypothetical protein [Mailhella massiliensis]